MIRFNDFKNSDVFRRAVEIHERKMSEPRITTDQIVDRLDEIFHRTETLWQNIVKYQFKEADYQIKYLLIGEAPPWHQSGMVSYFYNPNNPKIASRLLSTIYSAFSGLELKDSNEISNKDKIGRLCQEGFLLIDMLPFGFNYKKMGRKSKIYSQLSNFGVNYLVDKLDSLESLLMENHKIRVLYKSQIGPLRSCFPNGHFAQDQIKNHEAINTSTFGVPYAKDVVAGFDLAHKGVRGVGPQ